MRRRKRSAMVGAMRLSFCQLEYLAQAVNWNLAIATSGSGADLRTQMGPKSRDQPRSLGAATAHASLAGRQVLFEESRPLRRRMLREFARAWKLQATFAPNATGTEIAAAQLSFDFAVRPTAADGGPVSSRPDLPVVFATGYVDERIPPILSHFSKVRLLKKPFTLSEIQEVLSWRWDEAPSAEGIAAARPGPADSGESAIPA